MDGLERRKRVTGKRKECSQGWMFENWLQEFTGATAADKIHMFRHPWSHECNCEHSIHDLEIYQNLSWWQTLVHVIFGVIITLQQVCTRKFTLLPLSCCTCLSNFFQYCTYSLIFIFKFPLKLHPLIIFILSIFYLLIRVILRPV